MSISLDIVPPAETIIKCNFPDGTVVEADIMDIDLATSAIYNKAETDKIPYDTFLSEIMKWFSEKYDVKISKLSMDRLLGIKYEMMNKLKKNTYPSSDQTSTSISPQGTKESN